MFVLIDNTDEIRTSFFWREKNQIIRASSRANRPLLVLLEEVLAKRKKKISNLSGIAVVTGRGRFTASRVATTTANALGLALQIPVATIAEADFAKAEKLLKSKQAGTYVSAKYSAEARIGGKQSSMSSRGAKRRGDP